MSRSPEAKERDRLAAIARRAARKAGTAPAVAATPVAAIGEPIPQALRETVHEPAVVTTPAAKMPRPARRSEREAKRVKKAAAKAVSAPAKPRGGARKGAGAPAGQTVRMRVITFKGTQRHYDAFHAAGAGAWLRGVLDAGVAAKHIKVPK
jgi:hypothetical protein